MRKRFRRLGVLVAGLVTLALVLSACSSVVGGSATVRAAPNAHLDVVDVDHSSSFDQTVQNALSDIMGFWNPDANDPALLVWGQPWDIANWEMSEAFVKKWGWTVQECSELLKSTNRWRAQRGEKRLSLQ